MIMFINELIHSLWSVFATADIMFNYSLGIYCLTSKNEIIIYLYNFYKNNKT